jgi:hypothetical protein
MLRALFGGGGRQRSSEREASPPADGLAMSALTPADSADRFSLQHLQ